MDTNTPGIMAADAVAVDATAAPMIAAVPIAAVPIAAAVSAVSPVWGVAADIIISRIMGTSKVGRFETKVTEKKRALKLHALPPWRRH